MRYFATVVRLFTAVVLTLLIAGCVVNEGTVHKIAREEAMGALGEYKASFAPETFTFGIPWEKQFSYAEGVKVGNMIFISGQLAHGLDLNKDGWPKEDFMTGKSFDIQMRRTFDNMKVVLAHFGATMDDVVMLQNFINPDAGGNKVPDDWLNVIAGIISEYFPKAQHSMTIMEITKLFGEQQLVESNAIAVVH